MYLRNTSPSRIDVVKHPLAGAYEASTCELGYPLESLLLSSSVCLNSTFEPDTTAPLITGAENTSYTAIKLTFSEPLVRQAAEDPSNYEVVAYDKPAVTLVISQAELLGDGRSVGLYLAEPLVFGRTYFVHVHGLCDYWGNEISPSCEIPLTAGEQGLPKLRGISSEGDSVLYVEFNRPLAPGPASNPANYRIYCQPIDPTHPENGLCSAQPSAAALVTQMRIRLLFTSSKPPVETQLYLKVSNVTDTAGNPLASPYDIMGFVVLDPYPPIIQSVKVSGKRTVTALFNEIVRDSTVNVPGNYVIWREADTTATVPVIGALITLSKKGVTLTLGADLTAEVPYVLRARGIMDRRGNRMPAWNACGFSGSDTWPPIPLSAVALSRTLIRITFDEELDPTSAETMSNYTVVYFDQQIQGPVFVPISDASLEAGGCAVRLVLGGALSYDVEHTVLVRHVKDIRGNAINTEYSFTVLYPDLLPPSITSVTGVSQHKINLIFDMKLKPAQAELASNYELFESDDTTQAIPILGAALSSDQLRVTLALGEFLSSGRSYTISMSNIEDAKGHGVAPHTESVFTFVDTVAPSLLEAVETPPTSVSAYFSEPLELLTAENTVHYLITRGTETSPAVSISSALLTGDSSVVRLTLGEELSAGVSYVLHVSGVNDRSLNPLPADSKTPITKSDSLPPTFAAYSETSTRVSVLFDEPVTALTAGNPSNYRLVAITPPCDTVPPAAAEYMASRLVALTFSSALTPGHIYALHVSNVADFDGHPVAPGSENRFVCTPYPNGGAIGLYADNHRYNNISDRWANEFTMYVWCKPGSYGLTEAQLSVNYPSGVYPGPVTPNSSVVEAWSGDLVGWSTAAFAGCASGWVWICRQNCTVVNHAEAMITIASGVGSPLFTTCAEGHPTETANIICGLRLTDVAYVATLLKDFSASYRDGAVEISWQLSQLDDGARLTVSRAEPGSADYHELAGEIGKEDLAFSYSDTHVEPGKSYRYRVEYTNGATKRSLFETEQVAVPILPMALGQNWPNPFNPITTITYYLPHASATRLEVYDVSGRRIACLESGWKEGGKHSVGWDGRDASGRPAAAGIYLYRLTAGKETLSRKMILLR